MNKDIKIDDYVLQLKNMVLDAKEHVDKALNVYTETAESFEGDYMGRAAGNLKRYSSKLNRDVKSLSDFYQAAADYLQYSYDEMHSTDNELSNKIGGEKI